MIKLGYYIWPVLQVALIAASASWPRLIASSVTATVLTFASQLSWRSPWTWWTPLVAGLGLILVLSRASRRAARSQAADGQVKAAEPSGAMFAVRLRQAAAPAQGATGHQGSGPP